MRWFAARCAIDAVRIETVIPCSVYFWFNAVCDTVNASARFHPRDFRLVAPVIRQRKTLDLSAKLASWSTSGSRARPPLTLSSSWRPVSLV